MAPFGLVWNVNNVEVKPFRNVEDVKETSFFENVDMVVDWLWGEINGVRKEKTFRSARDRSDKVMELMYDLFPGVSDKKIHEVAQCKTKEELRYVIAEFDVVTAQHLDRIDTDRDIVADLKAMQEVFPGEDGTGKDHPIDVEYREPGDAARGQGPSPFFSDSHTPGGKHAHADPVLFPIPFVGSK